MARRKVQLPRGAYEKRPGVFGIDYTDAQGQRQREVVGPLAVACEVVERIRQEIAGFSSRGRRPAGCGLGRSSTRPSQI